MFYEIGSLAVVNVRDLGNVKYAFKVLAFPDTRIFQCSSNATKVTKDFLLHFEVMGFLQKEWLDKFDVAKKARLIQEQPKRESVADKSPSRSVSIDSPSLNRKFNSNFPHVNYKSLYLNKINVQLSMNKKKM